MVLVVDNSSNKVEEKLEQQQQLPMVLAGAAKPLVE
jgi:hypothetical protein